MKTIAVLTSAIAIALPTIASAHDTAPLRREMSRQAQLIQNARQTGDLTHMEAQKLDDEQSMIRGMLDDAIYDGAFTGREYRDVESALNLARQNIRRESNNDHVAYWRVRGKDNVDELGYPRELSRTGQGWNRGWGKRWGWGYGRRFSDSY